MTAIETRLSPTVNPVLPDTTTVAKLLVGTALTEIDTVPTGARYGALLLNDVVNSTLFIETESSVLTADNEDTTTVI